MKTTVKRQTQFLRNGQCVKLKFLSRELSVVSSLTVTVHTAPVILADKMGASIAAFTPPP